jgi:hypothetical protein
MATSQRSLKFVLTLATLVVWTAVLGAAGWKYKLSATLLAVRVHLTTSPSPVRIQINGQMHEGGAWIKTPVTLHVPAGRTRLRIQRDGYASQLVTVTGMPSSSFTMDSVVLGPRSDVEFAAVAIEAVAGAPETLEFAAEVNRGFVAGPLPLDMNDLEVGKDYVLSLRWTPENGKPREHRCSFSVTPESQSLRPVWSQGRLRIDSCRRLAAEKSTP